MSLAPEVTAIFKYHTGSSEPSSYDECYNETKESITKNQTARDTCVLNYEDEVLRRFGETLQTKVVFFSVSKRRLEKGLYLDRRYFLCRRHNGHKSDQCK